MPSPCQTRAGARTLPRPIAVEPPCFVAGFRVALEGPTHSPAPILRPCGHREHCERYGGAILAGPRPTTLAGILRGIGRITPGREARRPAAPNGQRPARPARCAPFQAPQHVTRPQRRPELRTNHDIPPNIGHCAQISKQHRCHS